MGIEFEFGTLTARDLKTDEEKLKFDNVRDMSIESETTVDEVPRFSFTNSFEGTISADLNQKFLSDQTSNRFYFCWDIPIIVMARWHKNARIRKKWLKRYGTKLDTMKVRIDPDNVLFNKESSELSYEASEIRFELTPRQMRRGYVVSMIGVWHK